MGKTMYHCNNCDVDVDYKVCPLCHSATKKTDIENDLTGYPFVKIKMSKRAIASKMYLAIEAICTFILFAIDYHFFQTLTWSVVGFFSIFLGYIIMQIFFNSLPTVFAKISKSLLAATIYLFFLDCFLNINRGWSIEYVMPVFLIGETVMNFFFTVINHRSFQNYMIAQLVTIILAAFAFSIGANFYLSLIAIVLSVLLFASTLLFGGFKGVSEIKRRFHINPEE
jgi:hypothetical protein